MCEPGQAERSSLKHIYPCLQDHRGEVVKGKLLSEAPKQTGDPPKEVEKWINARFL